MFEIQIRLPSNHNWFTYATAKIQEEAEEIASELDGSLQQVMKVKVVEAYGN